MNYENVRAMVNNAIELVDHRLSVDVTGIPDEDSWCQLDSLAFDQTFCGEDDDHDETVVAVHFHWGDPNTRCDNPNGMIDAEILLYDEDMVSPYFIAGQVYAKILEREKLF